MKYSMQELTAMATEFWNSQDTAKKNLLLDKLMERTKLSRDDCIARIQMLAMGMRV